MRNHYLSIVILCCFAFAGCGGLENPHTDQALNIPLGSGGLSLGMTKHEVIALYGDPDIKSDVTSAEWSGTREEWFYRAEMGALPVNAGYLSEDLYLYFDGDNLTKISKRSLGKVEK